MSNSPLSPAVSSVLEEGSGSLDDRLLRIAEFSPPKPRYTLLGELARGGMGRIVRVWDELLQRELAMKIVSIEPPAEPDEEESQTHERKLARFVDEARITGQLDHPGIVPVHDIALDGIGNVYFTMPLVRGETYKRVIELVQRGDAGWTRHRALDVLHKVCLTVAFAHSRGVIHRDLKPDNIMVGPFGEAYVMDWGLALIEGRSNRGSVVGTPAYMAPEQSTRPDEVGPRADVYSLGAILYELLGATTPHQVTVEEAAGRASLEQLLRTPPRPIDELVEDVPPELIAICRKAMQPDPEQRYESVRALADDLQAWLEGRVVRAHRTGKFAEVRKWRERNKPLWFALEALAGLALVSTVTLAAQQWSRIREVEAKNREKEQQSYSANLHAANLHLREAETTDARARLDQCSPELRGWEWQHLDLCCDPSAASLEGHEGPVRRVAVSDDETRIATCSDDGTVRVWNRFGEPLHRLDGHGDVVTAIAFRPRSLELASAGYDRRVRLWNAGDGTALREIETGSTSRPMALAYSSSGDRLAIADFDGHVRIVRADDDTLVRHVAGDGDPLASVLFDAAGDRLFVGDTSGFVSSWDLRTGSLEREEFLESHPVVALVLGPNEAELFAAVGANIRALHPRRLVPLRSLLGHESMVTGLAVDTAHGRLLSSSIDNTVRAWDLASGRVTETFSGHVNDVNAVASFPSGADFVTASEDKTARLWTTAAEPVIALRAHGDWVTAIAFDPDGERLVSVSRDATLRVWQATTGELLETIDTPGPAYCVGWARDGRVVFGGWDESLRLCRLGASDAWEVLRGDDLLPSAIAVHAASGRIVARYEHSARIWSPGDPDPELTIADLDEGYVAALSPDGALLATGSLNGVVSLRDASTGEVHRELRDVGAAVHAVAFSADGRFLAAGAQNLAVHVWSVASGELLRTFRGHERQVTSLAFSPDGSRLVSGSVDRTLRLWNPETGEALLTLREHESGVMAVAFSPDGSQIASASKDGTVRLWRTASTLARE